MIIFEFRRKVLQCFDRFSTKNKFEQNNKNPNLNFTNLSSKIVKLESVFMRRKTATLILFDLFHQPTLAFQHENVIANRSF